MQKSTRSAGARTRDRYIPSIPETMRAAAIDQFGGPEVLKLHSLPVPRLDNNEVLIAVHTAGVGPWDAEIREGWIAGPVRFPLVLGTDGSGTVVWAGSRVQRLGRGDRVYSYSWANPKGGFYAEYVAVAQERVATFPAVLNIEEAGAIAATGLTALQGVDDILGLDVGEYVVIHGAAGGVGTLALQFAKHRGARVLGTATTEAGLNFVRQHGADFAINGRAHNLTDAIAKWAPDGLDAVLALAGGEPLERVIDATKRSGRVAYPNGVDPPPKKRGGLKITAYDAKSGIKEFDRLNLAILDARPVVAIAGIFALEEAVESHKRLAQGHVLGKIVLDVAK